MMKTVKEIQNRLKGLEKVTIEGKNQARVIIHDPAKGAPVIFDNDSEAAIFLLPNNGRD